MELPQSQIKIGRVVEDTKVETKELTLNEIKKEAVLDRLILCEGNKTEAAKSLNVSIKTLYNWLHEWGVGLHPERKES